MFPGLPTCLRGGLVIGAVDEETQARIVTHGGKPWGCWIDDSTPNLEHWLDLALQKYVPLGQHVIVCVPPGRPGHHYPPPVISCYEAYWYGMGCAPADWLPLPTFDAYCIQWRWPGTHASKAPSLAERIRLLHAVRAHNPQIIFQF